jgi:hypothetical protein
MGNNPPNGFIKLDPDEYFKDIGCIVKNDVDRHEQEMKQAFTNYARDEFSINIVKSTIKGLDTEIKNGFTELESTANGLKGNYTITMRTLSTRKTSGCLASL